MLFLQTLEFIKNMKRQRPWKDDYGVIPIKQKKILPIKQYRARRARARRYRRGRDRTGGFYGRFSGDDAELKFFDTTTTLLFDATGEVSANATGGQMNLIPQGVTESTRVGRKCVIKSIYLRMVHTPATTTANSFCKFAIVLDKQANGAVPAYTDIYTTNASISAPLNLANSSRFQILKEFNLLANATAASTSDNWATLGNTVYSQPLRRIKWFKRCNIPLEFNSTTGAITEVRTNNLCIAYISSTGDDIHSATGIIRLRFSDGS